MAILRKRVFEENVRDYIGSDAEINAEILDTLDDGQRQKRNLACLIMISQLFHQMCEFKAETRFS